MENKPKIKIRNFWIWFKDQVKGYKDLINETLSKDVLKDEQCD